MQPQQESSPGRGDTRPEGSSGQAAGQNPLSLAEPRKQDTAVGQQQESISGKVYRGQNVQVTLGVGCQEEVYRYIII